MKLKKPLFIILFMTGLWITALQAQHAIPAAGSNAGGSGGTLSYSIGQVAYTSHTCNNGIINQGVQQAYDILIIAGIEETYCISVECAVYPNPVVDYVKLKIADATTYNLCYQLYDGNGKLLENCKVADVETIIPVGNLASAVYFIKVFCNDKQIKSFKLIKKH